MLLLLALACSPDGEDTATPTHEDHDDTDVEVEDTSPPERDDTGGDDTGSDDTSQPTDTGDTAAPVVDEDGDGFDAGSDCDDTDPDRYPGATELCDGVDDDCDDAVDGLNVPADFATVARRATCSSTSPPRHVSWSPRRRWR